MINYAKVLGPYLAPDPWNLIAHNISQGGHHCDPPQDGELEWPAVVGDEFDLVVSLYTDDMFDYGPPEGVEQERLYVPDGRLSNTQFRKIKALARRVALAARDGKRVLVRCQAGFNRSGLVVALALLDFGMPPDVTVPLIRSRRTSGAMSNPHFLVRLADEATRRGLFHGSPEELWRPRPTGTRPRRR